MIFLKRDLFLALAFEIFQNVIFGAKTWSPLKRSKRVKMTYFGVKTRGPWVPFGQNS